MSQGHRKSQGQTKKMYSLLARKKYFFCRDKVKKHYLILITIYGSFHLLFDTICDPIYVPSNNVPRTEKVKKSPDASSWTDFWPGWRIKYEQIILLMWANHYHQNPTLPPVEISFSGRLNTFVGNLSLGQCLEITLSLFKWWNLMFSYWTLMFGMYL